MKQVHGLDYPFDPSTCDTCLRLKVYEQAKLMLKDERMPVYIPSLPLKYFLPHRCTFDTIVEVERLYHGYLLHKSVYDEWMVVMGGDYQICGSKLLMKLWDDRRDILKTSNNHVSKTPIHRNNVMLYDKKYDELIDRRFSTYENRYIKGVRHLKYHKSAFGSKKRDEVKVLNKFFPFTAASDKSKTNLDFATLFNAIRIHLKHINLDKFLSYIPIGTYNSVATAMLMHFAGNARAPKMFDIIEADRAFLVKPLIFSKYLNAITTALRRAQYWPDGSKADLIDITQCSYWELCIGRSIMKSDWPQEFANRMKIHLPLKLPHHQSANAKTDFEYRKKLREHLADIVGELVTSNQRWTSFEDFVHDRQSWLAGGSSGGQHMVYDDKRMPIDKRTYFEHITSAEIIAWLDTEPKIQAVASEKFEQSKARAIYGTKCIDYTIMTYVINKIEPNLHNIEGVEGGLSGMDEIRAIFRRADICAEYDAECSMLDYADFNRQHTLEAQACVFEELTKILERYSKHKDVIKASRWCAQALLNQWVSFPHVDGQHKTIQGLFSGIRGTNFINTILNVAYYRVAQEYTEQHFGLFSDKTYNVHQGDDVWLSSMSRLRNITEFSVLKACGFDISNKKQMQGISIGEFLRVIYHKQGLRGFLARALGTFIERPLQAERDVSPASKATGINSQLMTLYRRGLCRELITAIWHETMHFQLTSVLGKDNPANIPVQVASRSYLDGGLDLGPPLTMSARSKLIYKIPTLRFKESKLYAAVPNHMSHDWISFISSKLQVPFNSKSLETNLHRANLVGSLPAKDKAKGVNSLHQSIRKWKVKLNRDKLMYNVERSDELFIDWIQNCENSEPAQDYINLLFDEKDIKRIKKQLSPINVVFRCINTSPFKDIHNAKVAFGKSFIDSAILCVCLSHLDDARIDALNIINYWRKCFGDEILTSILKGDRAAGPTYEALFNPIPLSILCKFALDLAIEIACISNIKCTNDWHSLLYKVQHNVLHTAVQDRRLLRVSKY